MAVEEPATLSKDFGQPGQATPDDGADHRQLHGSSLRQALPRIWWRLSLGAAALSIVGSIVALLRPRWIYGSETPALADAATAQDIVGLVLVAPLLLVLGVRAVRGGFRSWLCWLGCLSFTAYNYLIYTFSVHFGPLFLVWVAVLSLSLFALIGGLPALSPSVAVARLAFVPVRLPGWYLIAVSALFSLLWLSQIVADLLAARTSSSAAEWAVPTNPVHVLDLAFFLPAVFLTGVLLLRRHWFGYVTAAAQLVFLEFTCWPALVTPLVAQARGSPADWSVLVPLGIIAVTTLAVLWRLLRAVPAVP